MSKQLRSSILLVLAALIWGIAFVAQSEGGDALGPLAFNGIRNYIGVLALFPIIAIFDRMGISHKSKDEKERKMLIKAGVLCGIALCAASNFQQLGITYGTPVGKAGFLTTCYVIGVPILGLFFKRKCGWNIWVGVALTVTGLYLLCMNGSFTLQRSDVFVIICALLYSIQILIIDHYIPYVDGTRLSQMQFLVAATITVVLAFFTEWHHSFAYIAQWSSCLHDKGAWLSLLYAGVCSSGLAYTFQILGQDGINPTIASLLMSLESVFSVLAGMLLLGQMLTGREIGGCVLIFAAVVLAQINFEKKKNKEE